MSDGLNRVMLFGNLGADPELRMTNDGQAVLKMRMATSESYLDKNKVRQERTEWHRITLWGKRAEALAKFLTKGSKLFVEGSLRTTSYDDRDGNKKYTTEISANNVILAGGKPGSGSGGTGSAGGSSVPTGGGDDQDYGGGEGGSDDIPF